MYKWRAKLKDGKEEAEARGDGLNEKERKNCETFCWINKETDHKVCVNLNTGIFTINDQIMHASRGDVENISNRNEKDYRLIYAKRHFFSYGNVMGSDTVGAYLIGWQITVEDKNYKRILYVYPNGEIIFGGE